MFPKHTAPHLQKNFFLTGNGNGNGKRRKRRNIPKYSRERHTSPYKAFTAVFSRGAIYDKDKKCGDFSGVSGGLITLKKVSENQKKVLTNAEK